MAEGRFINDFYNTAKSNVIVVDEYFANRYFKRLDIIGETIIYRTTWGKLVNLQVVVTKSYGELYASMLDNENIPAMVYVPINHQSIYFNNKVLQSIEVSTEKEDGLKELGDRIVKALERKRGKSDLFYVRVHRIYKSSFEHFRCYFINSSCNCSYNPYCRWHGIVNIY